MLAFEQQGNLVSLEHDYDDRKSLGPSFGMGKYCVGPSLASPAFTTASAIL